jgi:acetyl-CoA C-acetyltransferase
MTPSVRRVAVIGGNRIPFARSNGPYAHASNSDMLAAALDGLIERYNLQGEKIGEMAAGAVLKHPRDRDLTREVVLGSKLAPETPAFDVQQACGTGLEAVILIANKIALGQIQAGIGAGSETMSDPPVVYPTSFRDLLLKSYRGRSSMERLKPWFGLRMRDLKPVLPGVVEPRTGLSMGQSCEIMAKTWHITREAQDQLAYESHTKAAAAWKEGFYDDLVVPFMGLKTDNNVRADTTLEKLGQLRTVFDRGPGGTLTAGNSTPLTDGASAVLLGTEEWARERNLPIQAWMVAGKTWAVDFASGKEGLLMAPVYAVSDMLRDTGLSLQDFDYYEIHEAFAAQALCTLAAWESAEFCRDRLGREQPLGSIDRAKMNVKGGSVALGHPFGATGTRIVAALAKLLAQNPSSKRGLISVCTAGGMGVTAILERA